MKWPDIPRRFWGQRSEVSFAAWSGGSKEAGLPPDLHCVLTRGSCCSASSSVATQPIVRPCSQSLPQRYHHQNPWLSTVQQSDRSRITLETNLWGCPWGSSYTGLIKWEDLCWMWQLHSLAGDPGLNKKERPSWALAFITLCFMPTETIQKMPGPFHYGFPITKDCDPSNCEPKWTFELCEYFIPTFGKVTNRPPYSNSMTIGLNLRLPCMSFRPQ